VSEVPKATSENEFVIVNWAMPEEAWELGAPDELKQALPLLQEALKKIEIKASFGTNFEEIVKDPLKPLPQHFKGLKVSADIQVALESLVMMAMMSDVPPPVAAGIKVLAGLMQEAKIGFDETTPLEIVSRLLETEKPPEDDFVAGCIDKGLENLRDKLYKQASKPTWEGGLDIIKNGGPNGEFNKDDMPDADLGSRCYGLLLLCFNSMAGIESISIEGIPESTLEFLITFEQVNPFILGQYLCGSWPKTPLRQLSTAKPVNDDENARLEGVFKTYDKDGSGSISLKELKAMIEELGGKLTDEEVEEAMAELDKNGDGTCCFDEFKTFWASKSGLGGHSDKIKKLLKMKHKMGKIASKGAAMLSNAGGYVGLADGLAETVVKWTSEFTPGMAEFNDEKMAVSADLDIEDVKTEELPRVKLVLTAKSEADAGECLTKITEVLESGFKDMLEMMVGAAPEFKQDGANLIVTMSAPDPGMVEMMLASSEDMLIVLTPAIKALRNSGMRWSFANNFEEFLASPDSPILELFAGAKMKAMISASSFGKRMFFKLIQKMSPSSASLYLECFKLFTGAEISSALGWHKGNLKDVMDMLPDEAKSPSGLRGMLFALAPGANDLPDEAKMLGQVVIDVAKKLDSIQSLAVENLPLPKEFSQNGQDATVGVRINCENVQPFALAHYLLEPVIEKCGLSA